jgi:hypothetical protein
LLQNPVLFLFHLLSLPQQPLAPWTPLISSNNLTSLAQSTSFMRLRFLLRTPLLCYPLRLRRSVPTAPKSASCPTSQVLVAGPTKRAESLTALQVLSGDRLLLMTSTYSLRCLPPFASAPKAVLRPF